MVTFTNQIPDFAKESTVNKVGEKVGENLTDNQKLILIEINKNNRISAKQLSESLGISSRKIEVNISKLKEKNLLERIGSAKGGHWKVTD